MQLKTFTSADDLKAFRQAQFVQRSRVFWSEYGGPVIDRLIIVLVPTVISAPSLIAFFK